MVPYQFERDESDRMYEEVHPDWFVLAVVGFVVEVEIQRKLEVVEQDSSDVVVIEQDSSNDVEMEAVVAYEDQFAVWEGCD